jgi:intracellular multiplication protein IcmK
MKLLLGAIVTLILLYGSAVAYAQDQQPSGGMANIATAIQKAVVPASLQPAENKVVKENDAAKSAPIVGKTEVKAKEPQADAADPLAEFKRLTTQDPTTQTGTPTPTPGGFQQQTDGMAMSDVGYNMDIIQDPAEKEAELLQKAREQAFDSAINGMMPMSPEQIQALLDKYKATREASEKRIGGSPKPEIVVETVSLEPGVAPPTIKLSPGHVTSVTMMDMTGQPWPVQDVSWGGNFEVISPGDGGHIIRISPLAATEVGNMSVQLVGLKTPVTFTLETQLEVVQYRFDARIPEYGPQATPPIIEPGITVEAGSDKAIGQILDGTPPSGTNKVRLTGVDARTSIFRIGDVTYLRTPLALLSPGWSASAKSADGTTVYVVNNTPVFLLSDRGKMVRAVVEENRENP